MCGIIGYIGKRDAAKVAVNGLEKLSYRGYDSAGIAVYSNGLHKKKAAGKIDALKALLEKEPLPTATAAIGHTRWATHGAVTDYNSHPHGNDNLLIVHNGIIENYLLLRSRLTALGYSFSSDTDTETAALLIDYYYSKSKDKLGAIREACDAIRGSYAILAMFADEPDEIWCVRHESPLLIGIGEGEHFISSDIPAFLAYTKSYLRLAEGEIVRINHSGLTIFNENNEPIEKIPEIAAFDAESAEKEGYDHFMRKEISDEVGIISKLSALYRGENGEPALTFDKESLRNITHISIIGCGTAYHAGLYGKIVLEKLTGIRTDCYVASEYRYSNPITDKNELVIFISQSGETADTLSCLRMAKRNGAKTLGIVNAVGSSIAMEADSTVYVQAGVEIAVASTKAYTAQCVTLALLAADLALSLGKIDLEEAKSLAASIAKTGKTIENYIKLEDAIIEVAKEIHTAENLFFIGRRYDYITAIEASLKLKEISYIHSEAYAAGELKHGTISLITEKTPVIALFGDKEMKDKTLSNLKEVAARGARTVAISVPDKHIAEVADIVIDLEDSDALFAPISMATVLQLLAYHIAKLRGCDIDQPRNLAKSVTVE